MNTIQITLNKGKSNHSVNVDNYLNVDLNGTNKLLPNSGLQDTIDEYQQYLNEKDKSNKYRLIFTINSICSNVLYNHMTEVVFGEGSEWCQLVTGTTDSNITASLYYKKIRGKHTKVYEIRTQDTGYSSRLGKSTIDSKYSFKYHPGIDIFNNHHLRRTDFVVINPLKGSLEEGESSTFNTIFDNLRDKNGESEMGLTDLTGIEMPLHLYDKNTILPCSTLNDFGIILDNSLKEENGWFGFTNKAILPITHYMLDSSTKNGITINKIMCDRRECDFIDLYPDRTLFSFVPKWNEYRRRAEYNWKYCLTYPFENVYDNSLVCSGITATFDDSDDNKIEFNIADESFNKETSNIRIRTNISHNLEEGNMVYLKLSCTYNNTSLNKTYDIPYEIRVNSVGKYGYDSRHYFSINFNDISYALRDVYTLSNGNVKSINIYVKKYINGRICKYYIRKFKRIPNFKNTQYTNLNRIDNTTINTVLKNNDFNSTINKLAFSKNIYGDDQAQIIFNDDVDVTGLRDNLGRELSVLYLTILKNNAGHNKWYSNGDKKGDEDIEYSHCFGNVTSGFDLPDYTNNFNVHKQHNIPASIPYLPQSSSKLENDIKMDSTNYTFYGDIVELDEETLTETVLETIQHRFNTAQRETTLDMYSALTVDNIVRDDYEYSYDKEKNKYIGGWATGRTNNLLGIYRANLAPEGYYYQAHYPIRIHEFDEEVNEGYHTYVNVADDSLDNRIIKGNVIINVDKNYYFNIGDEVYLFKRDVNTRYTGTITNVSSDYKTLSIGNISSSLNGTKISEYNLFRPNSEKPSTAYDLMDETGRYVWRNITKSAFIANDSELYDSTFTNGAHYIHKQINFYLKRQDPYGNYGLQPSGKNFGDATEPYSYLEVDGNDKDVSSGNYFEPGENNCLRF